MSGELEALNDISRKLDSIGEILIIILVTNWVFLFSIFCVLLTK